jgi:CrcB protein
VKQALIGATLVGCGGFLGALLRYGLSTSIQRINALSNFPSGTLVVNLTGCLLIGIAVGLAEARQVAEPHFRAFVLVGLLGGFTTFSTFGLDTLNLIRDQRLIHATANVGIHVFLGLALVWLGYITMSQR